MIHQKKTNLAFVILFISIIIGVSIFFSSVLLSSYSTLEEQYIEKDLILAVNKLNDELFTMSSIASDWGPWDDTVDFVNGNDSNYLNSNLQPYGFDNLNLNLMVFTNAKGEIIFSGSYDLQRKVMVPVPDFFSKKIDPDNPLMNMSDPHQGVKGTMMLDEGPILVVSQPIVHSDYSGPPQGVVIMGRYLNNEEISRLSALTRPSLTFIRMNDPALSPDLISQIRKGRSSVSGHIQPLNRDLIAGYALILDIYGDDALILQITESRDIYHQGINTAFQIILIILAGGLLLGLVVIKFSIDLRSRNSDLEQARNELATWNNELENRVLDRTKEIEKLLNQKDQFIDMVGHDLKTPLTPLCALLPILLKDEQKPESREIISILIKDTTLMREHIEKVLTLARLNRGSPLVNLKKIVVKKIVDNIIKSYSYSIQEKDLVVQNRVNNNFTLLMNTLHLEVVIRNILGNAIKYSGDKGVITISAEKDTDSNILSISDTGIGMTPDEIAHIFDEFYRADTSRHERDSHGLGLTIVKKIVDLYQGTIHAESEGKGKGSTIIIRIPNKIHECGDNDQQEA